ncbi:GNAT domain-containing protein [Sordaria brevicollis]|uniref:GNAT domain-containing protein n=1 Tax=Sordaria brevicollis TaxID=83679 RepID=A0AAE0PP56_SORBR|nr:GNAT domain-containing protein [Sordaria brevicollis]
MKLNESTAVTTTRALLVPYESRHVPTYHQWMEDPAIQAATASERLTLEEEYENQQSWRVSHDKLTFIICQPLSPSSSSSPSSSTVQAGEVDIPEKMIGDINLFLYPNDEEDAPEDECVGEVDIMIASAEHRGKGLGRAVVGGFLQYISRNLEGILREYYEGGSKQNGGNNGGKGGETVKMKMLMAKINKDNVKSIKLFKALGFEQEGEVNYFGEVKLVLRDLEGYARGNVPEGYQEVVYQREE